MGSNVACFQQRKAQKWNAEIEEMAALPAEKTQRLEGCSDVKDPSHHKHLLQKHKDMLKELIDPKGFLLMELLARDVLEDRERQWIKEGKSDGQMNLRLIEWLMENDANTFAVFLDSLRASHQEHIANLLEGKEGERVLTTDERRHISEIEPLLVILLDAKVGLVDMLHSCGAICKTDYQRIFAHSTDFQVNKKLLKVLIRSSNVTWQFFFEGLRETKQNHLIKYFDHGHVITARVEMTPHSCRHVVHERAVMDLVNDITRNLHMTPISLYVEDNRLVRELAKFNVECVCAHSRGLVVFYFYCPFLWALNQLWTLYQSGQLQNLVTDLFCIKSLDPQHAHFRVTMSKSDYKMCKQQLGNSESNSIMNLCITGSNETSQSTSIYKIPSSILEIILLKAAIRSVRTVLPNSATAVSQQQTFVLLSSVSFTWRKVLTDRNFAQQFCNHTTKTSVC